MHTILTEISERLVRISMPTTQQPSPPPSPTQHIISPTQEQQQQHSNSPPQAHHNRRNATMRLLPEPRGPGIDGSLPKKVRVLIDEHDELGLTRFSTVTSKTVKWGNKVAQAYSRRHYIYTHVKSLSSRQGIPMDTVAAVIDGEIAEKRQSVRTYLDELRKEDRSILRRRKRAQSNHVITRTSPFDPQQQEREQDREQHQRGEQRARQRTKSKKRGSRSQSFPPQGGLQVARGEGDIDPPPVGIRQSVINAADRFFDTVNI